jgi:nicotinamidase-related amidase
VSGLAVVVIDMLNPYDHEDADQLTGNVEGIIEPLSELIFVNDNYGDFAATREGLVEAALAGRRPDLVEPVVPPEGVDFLQKVRHSAFYSTALAYVLRRREIETLVLTGQVTEQCVLYSALDAYVRHFKIRVPRDAVAPVHLDLGDAALEMMKRNMDVEIVTAAEALS